MYNVFGLIAAVIVVNIVYIAIDAISKDYRRRHHVDTRPLDLRRLDARLRTSTWLCFIVVLAVAADLGLMNRQVSDIRFWIDTIVLLLLAAGLIVLNAMRKSFGNNTPLMAAVRRSDLEAVKDVLEKGADVNARGIRGHSALLGAVDGNSTEIALELISRGADVNVVYVDTAWHPLLDAARHNNLRVATALLDCGAHINKAEKNGFTPLHVAATYGHLDMVQLLVKRGADDSLRTRDGFTPIEIAKNTEVKDVLAKAGAHAPVQDNE